MKKSRKAAAKKPRAKAKPDTKPDTDASTTANATPGSTAQHQAAEIGATAEKARQEKAHNAAAEDHSEHNNSELADGVRHATAAFERKLPHGALSSGAWEAGPDDEGHEYPGVKDGRYRILGRDWIYTFKKGRIVAAEKGGPNTDPNSYVEFADQRLTAGRAV